MSKRTERGFKVTGVFAVALCLGAFTCGAARAQDQNHEERNGEHQDGNRGHQERQQQPQSQQGAQQEQRGQAQQRAQEQQRGQEQQRAQEQRQQQQQPAQQPRGQQRPGQYQSQQTPQEQQRGRQQPTPSSAQPQPQQRAQQQEQRGQDQQRGQERQRGAENQRPNGNQQYGRSTPQEQDRQSGRSYGEPQRDATRGAAPRAQDLQQARRVPRTDERNVFAENRARNWQGEHRDWRERGGYRGYRIPEAQFGAYFGPRHLFRIYDLPLDYVGGYPEFNYNGIWFTILDPVPEAWSPDWYQTDPVYVNYDAASGGYYLYDSRYPDLPLAVEPAVD